jgi:fibronectin type 3 domain-containing protein
MRLEPKSAHLSHNVGFLATALLLVALLSAAGCGGIAGGTPQNQTPNQSGSTVHPTAHSVTLTWNPSPSSVIGYDVYRSTQSGISYTLLNSGPVSTTSFTDSTVTKGQTYFYVVTAVDSALVQSGFSNEVFVTIPST